MSKASIIRQQASLDSSFGADTHGAVSDGAEGGPRLSTGRADRVQRLTSRHGAKAPRTAGRRPSYNETGAARGCTRDLTSPNNLARAPLITGRRHPHPIDEGVPAEKEETNRLPVMIFHALK